MVAKKATQYTTIYNATERKMNTQKLIVFVFVWFLLKNLFQQCKTRCVCSNVTVFVQFTQWHIDSNKNQHTVRLTMKTIAAWLALWQKLQECQVKTKSYYLKLSAFALFRFNKQTNESLPFATISTWLFKHSNLLHRRKQIVATVRQFCFHLTHTPKQNKSRPLSVTAILWFCYGCWRRFHSRLSFFLLCTSSHPKASQLIIL